MTTTTTHLHAGSASTCSACVTEFGGPTQPEHDVLVDVGATMYAADLRPGDLVVDETGARKFAAFDVDTAADPVRVWTGNADRAAGWPAVLEFAPGDVFAVVRR